MRHAGTDGVVCLSYLGRGLERGPKIDALSCGEELDGKDRTGVSTAFLLSVLGVERDLIEADYLLTNVDVPRQADFVEATTGFPDGIDREMMMTLAGVPETAMKDFLDGLEEQHGGPLEFLRSAGVTEDQMQAVRDRFLD